MGCLCGEHMQDICMYVTAQWKMSHETTPDVATCYFTETGLDAHFGASQIVNRPARISMTNA